MEKEETVRPVLPASWGSSGVWLPASVTLAVLVPPSLFKAKGKCPHWGCFLQLDLVTAHKGHKPPGIKSILLSEENVNGSFWYALPPVPCLDAGRTVTGGRGCWPEQPSDSPLGLGQALLSGWMGVPWGSVE